MNKNTVILIVVAIAIIVVLGFIFIGTDQGDEIINSEEIINDEDQNDENGENEATHTTVRGTIVGISDEEVPTDGPYLVQLETETGSVHTIEIPSMGINLCPAQDNIADVASLEVGMEIEARGIQGETDAIVPCTSEGHYVIKVEEEEAS